MKKLICIISTIALCSCAKSKPFQIGSQTVTVEPYGWMNEETKHDSIIYKINTGSVVWSIVGFETIVVPVVLTGKYLYEPIKKKKN
jgi:hypothetical protein